MSIETLKQARAKVLATQQCHPHAVLALAMEAEELLNQAIAEAEKQEPIGVMVSMDVSKGDEPEYRIFGRIYEVMKDGEGEDEVTYLAIEESRNFDRQQPKREPLTWQKLQEIWYATPSEDAWIDRVWAFARGVEAEHDIKEAA